MQQTSGFFRTSSKPINSIAMTHFNIPQGKSIATYPASSSNQITREYYNFLVGEINRGTIFRAVCRIENKRFGTTSHYLISER